MQKVSKHKTAMTYATAWLDAAKEQKMADKVFAEVGLLKQSVHAHADVWAILSQPTEDNLQKIKIIESLAKDIKLSKISTETLKLIVQNNRLALLELILSSFNEAYYKDKGIIEVVVDTAVALSDAQDKKLNKTLEEKLKAPVIINYRIMPEVLGGLAVHYNSFLIDDTLAGKLKRIKKIITRPQNG